MNKDNNTIPYYRFAALLPVMEDGPNAAPTNHPVTTLAADMKMARELAEDAGLILLGQLDSEGKIMTP